MTPEQLAILLPPIAGVIVAFGVLIYAISYAVRTVADASSKRAEKDRIAAETASKLADAVSLQLANVGAEVRRLGLKLDTSEGKLNDANEKLNEANSKLDEMVDKLRDQDTENTRTNAGLEQRNDKLRAGLVKDGSRETLDAVLEQDDKDKIKQQKDKQE